MVTLAGILIRFKKGFDEHVKILPHKNTSSFSTIQIKIYFLGLQSIFKKSTIDYQHITKNNREIHPVFGEKVASWAKKSGAQDLKCRLESQFIRLEIFQT